MIRNAMNTAAITAAAARHGPDLAQRWRDRFINGVGLKHGPDIGPQALGD
jgi:hypothetical protein